MPNHVTNRVHLTGDAARIRELLEAVRYDDGEIGTLDFSKLIPMPEELDMEFGSLTHRAIHAYLCAINPKNTAFPYPFKMHGDLFEALSAALGYSRPESRAKLVQKPADFGEQGDELVKLGRQYVDNYLHYGVTTWYDFRVAKWGSKWNSYNAQPLENDTLTFCTAYSRVLPVIAELARRFPDIEIEYAWADEDIGCNVGYAKFEGGELTEDFWYEPHTREAYEFAAEVMGSDLSEWSLVFNEDTQNYEFHYEETAEEEHPEMT